MKSEIILPQIEISRTLPSNYSAPRTVLKKTAEVKLIDFGKAYVNLNNLIFRGLRFMRESRPDFPKSFYRIQKLLVHLYFKSKIIDMKDMPVLVIADGYSPYFSHWMCDNLIRAYLVKKHYKNDFKVALPKIFYESNFCLETLEIIGIPKEQVIKFDKREAVTSNHVIFPTFMLGGGGPTTTYDSVTVEVANTILDYCKKNNALNFSLGERIFISRSKQKKRIILNQTEVDKVLSKYGFTTVYMEDFSFADSVAIAYNAKVIVSQCGSNLTNVMFCQAGTKILELYPRKEYDDLPGAIMIAEASQAFNLKHFYQYCEVDKTNTYLNEFHTDQIVDVVEFEANIKKILNQ